MKVAGAMWRWARLGFFLALGGASALVEACGGAGTTVKNDADLPHNDGPVAPPDAESPDAPQPDAPPVDAGPPADGSPGWDTPLE